MKKLFTFVFLAALCLCCLSSCTSYTENKWFDDEVLDGCLVPELPGIEKEFIGNGNDVCVAFSSTEFHSYAQSVYDYLKTQNFAYLGTRGEQKSTFKGLFTTYYFEPAEELDEFLVNGDYIFVYSDGTLDESGKDPIFCIVAIRYYGKTTVELNRKKTYTYTVEISVSSGSEAPLGGRYSLHEDPEEESALLSEYETWLAELVPDDIAEVKTTSEGVGVPPGSLKTTRSSTDKSIISRLLESYKCLEMTSITREEAEIDGGSALVLEFVLNDGTVKALSLNNGNYAYHGISHHDSPLYYFKLNSVPTLDYGENVTESYSFVTYEGTGTVYSGDTAVCKIQVDELEFVELKEKIGLPSRVMYEVETEFGNLVFQTTDIFYVEGNDGTYYRLVGESLEQLIDKAT